MKLLFITQKVDKTDSVLGAYHKWIEEFAKRFSFVTVICLYKGEFNLPVNVRVLSLGKEIKASRFGYLKNFYSYIWEERDNYDCVFVHMNEEYILLAGLFWRLIGKKVGMFRNHIKGTWKTPIAVLLSNVVWCTSPSSYTARFKKTKIVPAGINIAKFRIKTEQERIPNSILSIGRIGPVKNIDTFISALNILDSQGVEFRASLVGDPDPKDQSYYDKIKESGSDLVHKGKLTLKAAVPNPETPSLYQSNEIYVNMTNSGSLDKTIFSAMTSGTIPVISNTSLKGSVPDELIFKERDGEDMAIKLKTALTMSQKEKQELSAKLKDYVEENHSLEKAVELILKSYV